MTGPTDFCDRWDREARLHDPTGGSTSVVELEGRLAGPAFAPASLAELDRHDAFPTDACRVLDDFGLQRYYVPVRHGGLLADFSESLRLMRAVARRDLTVMIAHGKTFLGAVSVWVGGAADQAARLGAEIDAGAIVSWGLTERDHGSDLFAGELTAEPVDGGWELTGEKWLINNATRGHLICVLARTRAAGGPRGFSMFLVDKRLLSPGQFRYLPKVLTHGIRGADISGIVFDGARIPTSALVGGVGDGLAITLRALQLTRTGCAALSLGAADHALRIATDHAILTGLAAVPSARRVLGEAVASLLVAEATSVVASRSIHALTSEMNAISAITKAFVPSLVETMLDGVADLLGPEACRRGGEFEKLRRDHPIVGIFDGSTLVNRNALINQFPKLARSYRAEPYDETALATATTLSTPLPNFDPSQLTLLSRAGCTLVQSLPDAVARLHGTPAEPLALALLAATDSLHEELAGYTPSVRDVPPSAFALAERFELCFAGAACVQLWLRNPPSGPLWRDQLWLRATLAQILTALGVEADGTDLRGELAELVLAGEPLSLLPTGSRSRS